MLKTDTKCSMCEYDRGKDSTLCRPCCNPEATTCPNCKECCCDCHLQNHIKIIVEGGVVQDVTGLPQGYSYEVEDKDVTCQNCGGVDACNCE